MTIPHNNDTLLIGIKIPVQDSRPLSYISISISKIYKRKF